MGPPGWPELALLTPSITNPFITFTVNKSFLPSFKFLNCKIELVLIVTAFY